MTSTPRSLGDSLKQLGRRLTLVERRLSLSASGGGGISGPALMSSAAERDARYPSPFQGLRVVRLDRGWEEMYFEAYNSGANPGGATPAGWYPIAGALPTLLVSGLGSATPATGIWTSLPLAGGSPVHQNDGFVRSGTQAIAPLPGRYRVSAVITFSASTVGGLRGVRIDNGLGPQWQTLPRNTGWTANTLGLSLVAETFFTAPATQPLLVQAIQDSGGPLSVSIDSISVSYVGPYRG